MATPVTKRVHMSAYKRNSIAKQTTQSETGYYVKDGKRYKYDASATPGTKAAGSLLAPKAVPGGEAGDPWANKMKELFKSGVSIDELVKKGHGTKAGLSDLLKGVKQDGKSTPGSYKVTDQPVMTEGKKGTQIDTSTAYGVRQIGRGQKKSAKDVRRASIKLSKLADFSYNEDGTINMESIKPKDTSNPRKMAKFNERLSELKNMQNTQKRISDMASSGVDPRLTARYEFGRGMKEATEGGVSTDTEGLPTAEEIQNKYKGISEGTVNLGTVNPDAGKGTQTESVTENLTEDREPKKEPNKSLSSSYSGRADIGYSTMVAKKQGGVSMLKKSGMKMGGYGSKTYKK
jgi:hypothetical protein